MILGVLPVQTGNNKKNYANKCVKHDAYWHDRFYIKSHSISLIASILTFLSNLISDEKTTVQSRSLEEYLPFLLFKA